ncbi:MAG: radical SAM protein [Deltaproteobacteria bacterium]|nr:radical SAM protein [Deltaproteobacteria bacterium]
MKPVTVPFFISHQGCPHTCVFCDQKTISGAGGALPTQVEILSKIAVWRSGAGGRPVEVAFFGGSFTALPEKIQDELLAPLQPLLACGEISSVRLSTRPDCIDPERVLWLKNHGVRTIELGVQSMDDVVLDASGRGHTAAASEAAIRCIKRQGVLAGAQLMPGLPGDTPHSSLMSLERVISAGADFVRIYPTIVIRGTELARRYGAGEYFPLSLEQGVTLCKLLLHRALRAALPVIRIGLQADDGLNADTVLAGCWHPSLGQLVSSGLYGDLVGNYVAEGDSVEVFCHPSRLSDVTGHKRSNQERLAGRGVRIRLAADMTLDKKEIMIKRDNGYFRYNLVNDLKYSINEVYQQCAKIH